MRVIHSLMIFIFTTGCYCVNCPQGWTVGFDSCYLFHQKPLTWAEASHYCRSLNAHLARVESKDEHSILAAELEHLNGNFWLDGIDDVTEGDWRWASAFDEKINPTFWAPGEPDQPVHGTNEDCMDIKQSSHGLWNDERCFWRQSSICEMDVS